MSKTQQRVLRIGIVREGRVVHERLMQPGAGVTVGESIRNDFVFPATHLPKRFQLFRPSRGGYILRLSDSMDGKLSWQDEVVAIDTLRRQEARAVAGCWELPLPERARGKIVIDDMTVLFQFVAAPPEPRRIHANFRPRLWDDDDPVYFGFLGLHTALAAVGLIYVYTRPPAELLVMPDLPAPMIAHLVLAEPEPPAPLEPVVDPDASPTPVDDDQAMRTDHPKDDGSGPKAPSKPKPLGDRVDDAVAQSSFARAMGLGTTGENNNGDRIEDHFEEGALYADLDSFVREGEELVYYEDGPGFKDGPGSGPRLDEDIGTLTHLDVDDVVVGGPDGGPSITPPVLLEPPLDPSPQHNTIAKVIRANSGQLKACYDGELKLNPSTSGRMVLWFEISETGEVAEVAVLDNQTGSNGAFESCVTRRLSRWSFPAETAGTYSYPFVFTPTH